MRAEMIEWLEKHAELLRGVGSVSVAVLVITVVVLPVVVTKLPTDYFVRDNREPARQSRKHPLLWTILSLCKNLLGLLFIMIGIVMLALPGQGTVTILTGLAISNFPGKFVIEQRIAGQPAGGRMLNRIRQSFGVPPLQMPEASENDAGSK